jgi:ornithine cyclodeaminase
MRPAIFTLREIQQAIDIPALIESIEEGLILSSQGKAVLAPVSMLHFEHPLGEVHIKSGNIISDDRYVVKIASGFPENPRLGISSSQGLMLLFSGKTGVLETILLDEGYLTDLRTGIAGAICAKHFAPKNISRIGIVGTGNQAFMQLNCLRYVTDCRHVIVWGRNDQRLLEFSKNPQLAEFKIQTTTDLSELCRSCHLIVTATRSSKPLIFADDLLPSVHMTAVGADQPGKQEIAAEAIAKADLIFVDSMDQCLKYGDLSYAKDRISLDKVQEIGSALQSRSFRRDPQAITIADLTGVAIEDIQIAKAVTDKLSKTKQM